MGKRLVPRTEGARADGGGSSVFPRPTREIRWGRGPGAGGGQPGSKLFQSETTNTCEHRPPVFRREWGGGGGGGGRVCCGDWGGGTRFARAGGTGGGGAGGRTVYKQNGGRIILSKKRRPGATGRIPPGNRRGLAPSAEFPATGPHAEQRRSRGPRLGLAGGRGRGPARGLEKRRERGPLGFSGRASIPGCATPRTVKPHLPAFRDGEGPATGTIKNVGGAEEWGPRAFRRGFGLGKGRDLGRRGMGKVTLLILGGPLAGGGGGVGPRGPPPTPGRDAPDEKGRKGPDYFSGPALAGRPFRSPSGGAENKHPPAGAKSVLARFFPPENEEFKGKKKPFQFTGRGGGFSGDKRGLLANVVVRPFASGDGQRAPGLGWGGMGGRGGGGTPGARFFYFFFFFSTLFPRQTTTSQKTAGGELGEKPRFFSRQAGAARPKPFEASVPTTPR